MSNLRICIVGGSITGCTAAISALKKGIQPQIYEKSSSVLKERGAGLGLPSQVALSLRDQDFLYDGFPHVSIRSIAHSSISESDARLGGSAGAVPTYLEGVRWGHLFERLRSLVPNENYQSGIAVTHAQNAGDSVKVTFETGHVDHYDAVVFADGYKSIGRSIVSPEHQPEYQGYFIWRGTLPERDTDDAGLFDGTLQRIGFPLGHFFSYLLPSESGSISVGDREVNWGMYLPLTAKKLNEYLVDRNGSQRDLSLPPGSMRDDLERELKKNARTLLPDYFADLVMRSENTFGQGIVAAIPNTYHKGRICLAGDAGAVVPPFTTSGVFKGMKNAAELVAALTSGGDLNRALDEWDAEQQKAGDGLKRLSEVMSMKLITDVPDFSEMSQSGLITWWSEIQSTLEETMA